MHKDLAKDGLVVISLSVDDPDDRAKALSFLKEQNAEFQNFLLVETDENKDKWDKVWAHSSPPHMHVFDRTGKLSKSFTGKAETDKAEGFIKELLKK